MLGKKCNGYKILLIAEILLIMVLLPGCFHKEKLIATFWGEDIAGQTTQEEDYVGFGSERMELTPGVYKIKIQARLADEQSMSVEMKSDGTYFRALRGNAVTVLSGDDYEEFNVYVVDKVFTAYVQCNFYNTDTNALKQLEVYKSNLGNRMLVFIVLMVSVALDFLVVFRKRILEGKVTKKQQVVFWTLAAGVLIAYFPYLTDYFSFGCDTTVHLSRIAYLKDALQQGASFPVRMQSTWIYDHGYPVSMFYGDLFLYIPAFLMMIGFSVMSAYKMFVFVTMVATAVIAYHCFEKCVKEEYAALFGAMVYMLAPYRLHNIYGRGAVGEFLAMVFLPLICCGMYLLYTEDVQSKDYKKYKWYVVLGMSGILQSHLISTEMSVVFMALFCLIFWRKTFRKQTVCQLLEATGITLLINAWFWVPLLCMMSCDTYNLQKLTQEDVQSRGLLLESLLQVLPNRESVQTGVVGREPAHLGAGAVMLLIIYVLWCCYRRKIGKKNDKICSTLVGFCVVAVILCTGYFPWNTLAGVPGIGFIAASLQFPWRWMSPATVLLSLFAAFFFTRIQKEGGVLVKAAIGTAALITIFSSVYHVNRFAFESNPMYLYNIENVGNINVGNGEYLLSETTLSEVHYHKPVAEERGAHGDLRIAVPAGYQGTIQISYQGFTAFHVAEAVSLIALVILLGMYLYQRRKRVQNGN